MLTRPPSDRGQDGFSLIELMVVIVILGVIGAFTVTALVQGMDTSDRVAARVEALTSLEMASQRLGREVRRGTWVSAYVDTTSAASPTSSTPRECVLPATGSSVDVATLKESDLSLVSIHGGERWRTRVQLVDGDLTMDVDRWVDRSTGWVDHSVQTLASDLTNGGNTVPVFTYLDGDGVEISPNPSTGTFGSPEIDRVRKVRVRLRADARGTDPIEVQTVIAPRNGGSSCSTL
jgi:prepilin-type N-terminal cleavage/methylation domain-containing protein